MDSNSTISSVEVAGVFSPTDEQLELLQSILQANSSKLVTLDETREVGVQLVSLYEYLSKNRSPAETQVYERQQ